MLTLARFFYVIVSLLIFSSTVQAEPAYLAFSLREAVNSALNGKKSETLLKLGGLTRIAGMVYDLEGKDIILVGLSLPGMPEARFDDLVTALRARLVYNEFPLVSIDPVEDSEKTKIQRVRFDGHLENTSFGKDFLECDIILKRYSLQKINPLISVPSYNRLLEQDIRDQVKPSGIRVNRIKWHGADDGLKLVHNHQGMPVASSALHQARFWFYVKEPYVTVDKDGVFLIRELRLALKSENLYQDREALPNKAQELFTKNWTEHFTEISRNLPKLKKLKVLYDLVAVADALRNMERQPYLDSLLKKYRPEQVLTESTYRLEELFGVVERSDGLYHLVKISGGIEFRPEIKKLNYGLFKELRSIVLNSRPSSKAMAWALPLKGWQMPNSQDIDLFTDKSAQGTDKNILGTPPKNGFSLSCQSITLNPNLTVEQGNVRRFTGFPSLAFSPSPLKGVSMKMIVNNEAFKREPDNKLKELGEKILKSRPPSGAIGWENK